MTIERLERIIYTIQNGEDVTEISRLPEIREVVDKLNEIIDYINNKEKQ